MTDTSLSTAAMQRAAAEVVAFPRRYESFNSEVDGRVVVCKGETEFIRVKEFERVLSVVHGAILALPAPSPAALLAEAVKLPEVRALIKEALDAAYAIDVAYGDPHDEDDPHRYSKKLRAALAALPQETRHEGAE